MTPRQRIEIRMSDRKQRLSTILERGDDIEAAERAELDQLTAGLRDDEVELRAAILVDPEASTTTSNSAVEGTDPERLELRSRVKVTDYLGAMVASQNLAGAAAELNSELGLTGNRIPFEVLNQRATSLESRAVTTSPATVGVNMAPIEPFAFASSAAPMLGISMPSVGTGTYSVPTITTSTAAEAVAESDGTPDSGEAVATAGVIGVSSMTPKRVSGRLSWTLEATAKIGMPDFEAAMRSNLQMALSDQLDHYLLKDTTKAAHPEGIMGALTAATTATTEVTYSSAVELFAGLVDGLWARKLGDIRALVNPLTIAKLEGLLQVPHTQGARGERSVANYLRDNMAGLSAHYRMPDSTGNGTDRAGTGIAFRAGDGLMQRPMTAVCANWGYVEISDPYSDSEKAITHVTVHTLVSDVQVLQSSAYALFSIKTA